MTSPSRRSDPAVARAAKVRKRVSDPEGLDPRERLFVEAYVLNGGNATRAYLAESSRRVATTSSDSTRLRIPSRQPRLKTHARARTHWRCQALTSREHYAATRCRCPSRTGGVRASSNAVLVRRPRRTAARPLAELSDFQPAGCMILARRCHAFSVEASPPSALS